MVFRGRLRFADAEGAQRAHERLVQVGLLSGHVVVHGCAVELDAQTMGDAAEYPAVIALLDDVADEAIGGSVTARLGGQPSDWVGAAAPIPGLEELSPEAQDLLRAVIGVDPDAVEAGRADVVARDDLLPELLAGWATLEEHDQRALFVLLVGDRPDPELAPIMRAALDLPAGEDVYDVARHVALGWLAGRRDLPFDWTDRERVASEIARVKAQGSARS